MAGNVIAFPDPLAGLVGTERQVVEIFRRLDRHQKDFMLGTVTMLARPPEASTADERRWCARMHREGARKFLFPIAARLKALADDFEGDTNSYFVRGLCRLALRSEAELTSDERRLLRIAERIADTADQSGPKRLAALFARVRRLARELFAEGNEAAA